jgi:predicted Rossmann fold flavoprotein
LRISSEKKHVHTRVFDALPARLWEALCKRAGISDEMKWADLSSKAFNSLITTLCADAYSMQGKTTFKEEFVTCGGVSLKEIDSQTCMSRRIPGLFFAGEVLDVDGITGGFNFQHAWASGFVAGTAVANRLK